MKGFVYMGSLTMKNAELICFCFYLLANLVAVASSDEGSTTLDVSNKKVKRLVVTSSQIGYRNTLLFYTFEDQKIVLKVMVDNQDKKFPVTATIYQFADDASAEGLDKWLNNQHSDGLYPEVPEPLATSKVPADCCKILSQKRVGQEKQPFGVYDNYSVEFQLKGVPELSGVRLRDFKATASVYIKTE